VPLIKSLRLRGWFKTDVPLMMYCIHRRTFFQYLKSSFLRQLLCTGILHGFAYIRAKGARKTKYFLYPNDTPASTMYLST